MKGAFQYMRKELNKIKQIKEINDPFSYMNSLLKLFNTSLSMNFIGGHNILNVDKNEVFKFNKLFNYNMYNNIDEKKQKKIIIMKRMKKITTMKTKIILI